MYLSPFLQQYLMFRGQTPATAGSGNGVTTTGTPSNDPLASYLGTAAKTGHASSGGAPSVVPVGPANTPATAGGAPFGTIAAGAGVKVLDPVFPKVGNAVENWLSDVFKGPSATGADAANAGADYAAQSAAVDGDLGQGYDNAGGSSGDWSAIDYGSQTPAYTGGDDWFGSLFDGWFSRGGTVPGYANGGVVNILAPTDWNSPYPSDQGGFSAGSAGPGGSQIGGTQVGGSSIGNANAAGASPGATSAAGAAPGSSGPSSFGTIGSFDTNGLTGAMAKGTAIGALTGGPFGALVGAGAPIAGRAMDALLGPSINAMLGWLGFSPSSSPSPASDASSMGYGYGAAAANAGAANAAQSSANDGWGQTYDNGGGSSGGWGQGIGGGPGQGSEGWGQGLGEGDNGTGGFGGYAKGGIVPLRYAGGGPVPFGPGTANLIASSVPGRTDAIPAAPAPGSVVIPADVVSGVGQGNTLAGDQIIRSMFAGAPFGMTPPAPSQALAAPGGQPIQAAGGEEVVDPAALVRVGGGDLRRGQDIVNDWIRQSRELNIRQLQNLPGPRHAGR